MNQSQKDYIEITNDKNKTRKVEVVALFDLEGWKSHYIIYKELDNSHYYLAKYQGEEIINLDTNITKEEYDRANAIFKGVMKE